LVQLLLYAKTKWLIAIFGEWAEAATQAWSEVNAMHNQSTQRQTSLNLFRRSGVMSALLSTLGVVDAGASPMDDVSPPSPTDPSA
jgi:hypothetical protein